MRLIAGIDPGTTVGFALLDLSGKVVATGSKKEFDLDSLVSEVSKFGKVIIVGCDKAKVPGFVEKFSAKFGAKIFSPSYDVLVDEKRDLTRDFDTKNTHESDALASALLAFRRVFPLFNRIRNVLNDIKKQDLFERIVEFVLKEEVSIKSAVAILSFVEKPTEVIEKVEPERDDDVVKLFSSLSRVRKDNAVLLKRNEVLSRRVSELENSLNMLKEHASKLVKPKSSAEMAKLREGKVMSLSQRLKHVSDERDSLKYHISFLESVLLRDDLVVLPRLSRLSYDEVMRVKDLLQHHLLFIDDVNEMSDRAVSLLKDKQVGMVVCGRRVGNKASRILPFACVFCDDVILLDKLVLVKKSWLEKVRSERAVLFKVFEEYKKTRKV